MAGSNTMCICPVDCYCQTALQETSCTHTSQSSLFPSFDNRVSNQFWGLAQSERIKIHLSFFKKIFILFTSLHRVSAATCRAFQLGHVTLSGYDTWETGFLDFQGSNLGPLHWKHAVTVTELLGNPLLNFFFFNSLFLQKAASGTNRAM